MSTVETRPTENFRLWLLVSAGVVTGAALFCAAREKPPVIFALGFGLVMGLVLRLLAAQLAVAPSRRVILCVLLLSAVGFAGCFGLGYRRMALEWKAQHPTGTNHPLAAALLKSFPDSDPTEMIAAQQRFTFSDYLSLRAPHWPSPWPLVVFGAEWMLCITAAGLCVGIR